MSNVVIVLLFHPSKLSVFCSSFWTITPFLKLPSTRSTGISGEEMEKKLLFFRMYFRSFKKSRKLKYLLAVSIFKLKQVKQSSKSAMASVAKSFKGGNGDSYAFYDL